MVRREDSYILSLRNTSKMGPPPSRECDTQTYQIMAHLIRYICFTIAFANYELRNILHLDVQKLDHPLVACDSTAITNLCKNTRPVRR
jgi:hypothetical protein